MPAPRFIERGHQGLGPRNKFRRNLWHRGESIYQRVEVKPCATNENQFLILLMSLLNLFVSIVQPRPGRIAHLRVHMPEQKMGRRRHFRRVGPCRQPVEHAIDLHGIGVDDPRATRARHGDGQRRLAARGRTRYQHRALVPLLCHGDAMSVLVLIANPSEPALSGALVDAIHRDTHGEINWLAQGIACEIMAPSAANPLEIARDAIGNLPIDAAHIPLANRRKQLLVADMDSTMIEQECIDELAAALDLKPQVAEITERAMRGELDFEAALDTRVALLKGLERKIVEEVRRERITLAPGGRALVQTMKAYGAYTALVSGGFTLFADHFAGRIGFDEAVANVLEFDAENRLTGTVEKPIVDKTTKRNRLRALTAEKRLSIAQTMAVGDGANDLDMLQAAGLGVAIHAKPLVAEQAEVRIDHADLTALLYLQGYGDDDIVR